MGSTGAHLADLRGLSRKDVFAAVISQHGSDIISRYGDNLWQLAPYLPAKNRKQTTIRFDVHFVDGSCLTDLRHSGLLDAAKRFLYARWRERTSHSQRHISAATLFSNWANLRSIIEWMVERGINSFGELTSELCLAYASSQEGKLKETSKVTCLHVLSTYFHLRDHLIDRLPEYPWPDSAQLVLARKGQYQFANGRLQAKTEIIPARILRQLVQASLDFVENRADGILQTRDEMLRLRSFVFEKAVAAHRERHPEGFSSHYRNEETYFANLRHTVLSRVANQICSKNGFMSPADFKKQLLHLRTSCFVICAVFSGMRDSELASLDVGCFSRRDGYDGEEFYWLKGFTYKLEDEPMPVEWMVPKIVGRAVEIATRLGKPLREKCAARISEIEKNLSDSASQSITNKKLLLELNRLRKHQYSLMLTIRKNGKLTAFSGWAAT